MSYLDYCDEVIEISENEEKTPPRRLKPQRLNFTDSSVHPDSTIGTSFFDHTQPNILDTPDVNMFYPSNTQGLIRSPRPAPSRPATPDDDPRVLSFLQYLQNKNQEVSRPEPSMVHTPSRPGTPEEDSQVLSFLQYLQCRKEEMQRLQPATPASVWYPSGRLPDTPPPRRFPPPPSPPYFPEPHPAMFAPATAQFVSSTPVTPIRRQRPRTPDHSFEKTRYDSTQLDSRMFSPTGAQFVTSTQVSRRHMPITQDLSFAKTRYNMTESTINSSFFDRSSQLRMRTARGAESLPSPEIIGSFSPANARASTSPIQGDSARAPNASILEWFDKSVEDELHKRQQDTTPPKLDLANTSGTGHPSIVESSISVVDFEASMRGAMDTDMNEAVDSFLKAQALVSFEGAIRAAEEAAASVPPEFAEEAAVAGAKGYQAELTSVVRQKVPGVKPVEVIGYVGITKPKFRKRTASSQAQA